MDRVEMIKWAVKICEIIAAITGCICWFKWRKTYWKWFPVYLIFIALSEFVGRYLSQNISHQANNYYYSFVVRPSTYLFFFWIFYSYDRVKGIKKKPQLYISILFIICVIADYFFFQHRKYWIQSFSMSMGTVLLLVLLVRFFLHFLFKGDIFKFYREMMFWFSVIIFIYYLGTFPFFALRNTLASNYPVLFINYWYVQMGLSCLMYLLFAFSLIWTKPRS